MNSNNKVISSLCYFSIFFAPFLLPLIVYFIVDDSEVKRHAISSLLSHIFPVIIIPLFIIAVIFNSIGLFFFLFVLSGILTIAIYAWNIIKGIQLLKQS